MLAPDHYILKRQGLLLLERVLWVWMVECSVHAICCLLQFRERFLILDWVLNFRKMSRHSSWMDYLPVNSSMVCWRKMNTNVTIWCFLSFGSIQTRLLNILRTPSWQKQKRCTPSSWLNYIPEAHLGTRILKHGCCHWIERWEHWRVQWISCSTIIENVNCLLWNSISLITYVMICRYS